ncbi:galactose mutarotase [Blastopirellula marina]|uniref:Aldose 1-epimerase n=2 Tax=Blastopirellula marina TaxID=124 RepID=A0A2S8FF99_9BACT|nr:galactose-1-epimerase [Blastopirellula marina]PTL42704.1 galactose mutarotase [Blastopirellula marina]
MRCWCVLTLAASLLGTQFVLAAEPTQSAAKSNPVMSIESQPFGKTADGQEVTLFTVKNGDLEMELINYGASIVSLKAPDKNGTLVNVNVGFDDVSRYEGAHPYFGATVGRYANRIAKGKFSLDGKEYSLALNNGENTLHGGEKGFNRYVWDAKEAKQGDAVGVTFSRTSPAGEEGYPGALTVSVSYLLTGDNQLVMDYAAETDAPTVLNLTNHCYWNLAGAESGKVYDHELKLEADAYIPVSDALIPTGKEATVKGTPMDFTTMKPIGKDLQATGGDPIGYDHCYVLRSQDGTLALAATVKDPKSGRVMEIYTTEPGIQLYTGNFLTGAAAEKRLNQHEAFCLETQHYPDTPNQPNFPTTTLKPGEKFQSKTVHKFSVEK